jgi:hypothetical protein
MPATLTPAQSLASRPNGARPTAPATKDGKARSALNAVRHGLSGRTFFLLPDEDPEEFAAHEAECLAAWRPRDHAEREAALAAIRAMWREIRGDRLEGQVLTGLFAAGRIEDVAEREAARTAGFREVATLLRYHVRIGRELTAAMATLRELRQRRAAVAPVPRRHEPEPAPQPAAMPVLAAEAPVRSEPEPALNHHQRRALAAMVRKRAA